MTDKRIDQVLLLRFDAPHSYTGENVIELQCHGGRAVTAALLAALGRLGGFRPARPGEFTRRAVENGRLDLAQGEAVADLVEAETEAQRRQALGQFEGHLSAVYEDWRARLIKAAAWFEAVIDFPDDEIPPQAPSVSRRQLQVLLHELRAHLADGRRGEILREGFHVAVIGPPNAGKSALVNALARRDVAIVSDIPGTTRDVIEVRLDLKGYPVILADTAGLRESGDAIEREGVRRAEDRARQANARLLVLDGAAGPGAAIAPDILAGAEIIAFNKCDLVVNRTPGLWISAKTGEGLKELIDRLAGLAEAGLGGEAPVLTRARHRREVEDAAGAIERALAAPMENVELAAEGLRAALASLGRLTGRIGLEELLDVVFHDFCIGK